MQCKLSSFDKSVFFNVKPKTNFTALFVKHTTAIAKLIIQQKTILFQFPVG